MFDVKIKQRFKKLVNINTFGAATVHVNCVSNII